MSADSLLSSFVEIGIGIAGFAGIVAAIRQRDINTWDPAHLLLIQALFSAAAAAISISLLPGFLTEAGFLEFRIWQTGSAVVCLWFVVATSFRLRQLRDRKIPLPVHPLMLVWVAVIVLLQIANFSLSASWPFLLGVFALLVNAFVFFIRLLLGPAKQVRRAA